MRLLRASLRKLLRRPAARITLIVLVLLLALIYVSIGVSAQASPDDDTLDGVAAIVTFPEAYGNLASILVVFVGLGAAAFGATVGGSEWSWSTFRLAVARGESRSRYVLLTYAGVAIVVLIGWLALFAVGVALIPLGAALGGLAPGDPTDPDALGTLPLMLAGGWWAVVMEGAIGFAIAFIARSQVAGIVAVIGLYLGEQFAAIALPAELLRLAPLAAASSLAAEAGRGATTSDALVPLVMTTVYMGLAAVAVALYARRTEVA